MFTKEKSTQLISEVSIQRQTLEELQGTSATYASFIESTIENLVTTNENIETEIAKTNTLLADLTNTKVRLQELREANLVLINQLNEIFSEK